jgi:uncharacterized protein YmfQ (DUF2313 family)
MSRSTEEAQAGIIANAPRGWAWPHVAAGAEESLFEALFRPLAKGLAAVEATAEAMMEEIDPRTANLLLPDFERVLGPDPCGRDTATMSLEQRRQLAHQRWTARGGASIAYFVGLAAKRGVSIEIVENRVSMADAAVAGDELVESPEQFCWTVELTLLGEIVAKVDDAQAGDLLLDIILSDVECDIRRAKPAHTDVAFRYI